MYLVPLLVLVVLGSFSVADASLPGGSGPPGVSAPLSFDIFDSDSDSATVDLSSRSDTLPSSQGNRASVRGPPLPPSVALELEVRGHSDFDDPTSRVVRRLLRRARRAIRSLVGAQARSPLSVFGLGTSFSSLGTDAAEVEERLHSTLRLYGAPSCSLPPVGSCLSDLLKGVDAVVGGDATTVRPYDALRVKLVGSNHSAVDVEDLADDELLQILRDPTRTMLLGGDAPIPADVPLVYTDPALKEHKHMRGLVSRMHSMGVCVFTLVRHCIVGAFTVAKKDHWLRLVFDCRLTNLHFRAPPRTALSTPSALSSVRFSGPLFEGAQARHPDRPFSGRLVAFDWVDSFYQFRWLRLCTWFGLEGVFTAGEVGVSQAYDSSMHLVDVCPNTPVFACLSTVPMGWNWALHVVHSVLVRCMVLALGLLGVSHADAKSLLVLDGRPAPLPEPGRPLLFPYVDNAQMLAWDDEEAAVLSRALAYVFYNFGLKFRVECDGEPSHNALGVCLLAGNKAIINKPNRMWRLRCALIELRAQGCASGDVMQVVNGHVVYSLLIARYLLCVPQAMFAFAVRNLGSVQAFSRELNCELNVLIDLLPFVICRLDLGVSNEVYASDASLKGFAIHSKKVSRNDVVTAISCREVWKFKIPRDAPLDGDVG